MNKLQTEIEKAIVDHVWRDQIDQTAIAKAAAEVALKWIEKAFNAAYIIGVHDGSIAEKKHNYNNIGPNYSKENWLKENGLTPTEPGKLLSGNTEQLIIGSNGITDPPNETKF